MKQRAYLFILPVFILFASSLFLSHNVSSQEPESTPPPAAEPATVLAPTAPSNLLFSYQGQLLDANGNPVTNSALPITFKLFTTESGGTACWEEAHTVDVQNGLFHVLLGETTAIDADACLQGDAYLELTVNGETMSPRELLASVAHATEATTLPAGAVTRGSLEVNGDLSVPSTKELKVDAGGGRYIEVGYDVDNYEGYLAAPGRNLRLGTGWNEALSLVAGNHGIKFDSQTSSTNRTTRMIINSNGNVCIGTEVCDHRLEIRGGNIEIENDNTDNYIRFHDPNDLWFTVGMKKSDGRFYINRGGSLGETSDGIIIHNNGNVGIGVTNPGHKLDINGDVQVKGANIRFGGTGNGEPALRQDGSRYLHLLPWGGSGHAWDQVCIGCGSRANLVVNGNVTCGGLVESNLLTEEEKFLDKNERFEEGDVLCWGIDQLELCTTANDPLVQAVADANGRPIVVGAENIKVVGPVKRGDYLVASNIPGYAMATHNPTFGIVIAQALEDFDGEKGIIKAMIRKM